MDEFSMKRLLKLAIFGNAFIAGFFFLFAALVFAIIEHDANAEIFGVLSLFSFVIAFFNFEYPS